MDKLIIGTRGSKLALWQAYYTQEKLEAIGIESELKIIKTQGDKIQHLGFDKLEGKGFFTKEIEDALLNNEVDVAVHSMKDMPTTQPEGLCLAGVSYREDCADLLVIRKEMADTNQLLQIPQNGIVGTSSARRKAQMQTARPDVQLKDIRGNVPTRLQKLRDGEFDAILLAIAGINRLKIDMTEFITIRLSPKEFIPAPAQGVLTWQTKSDNTKVRKIVRKLHDSEVLKCTNVERKVLRMLEGGCHMPLGVYCERDSLGHFHVWATLGSDVGEELKFVTMSSSTTNNLAEQVFDKLQK